MSEAEQIESGIQLLVEGNDQRNFFEAFKRHLSLESIQIRSYGGGQDFREFLKGFVQIDGFGTVQSLGVVRDAEINAENTFRSVQGSSKDVGLTVPAHPALRSGGKPAVNVLILPDNRQPGMLETLLCQTFAGTPRDACIEAFFECITAIDFEAVKRRDKARAWAYLTTKPDPHHSVGFATMKGYWGDLDQPVFEGVRAFLLSL